MMKNGILTIARKEFARFFRDRRMVITTLFLPAILIYLVYSLMGSGMEKIFHTDTVDTYVIYTENMPESISTLFDAPMIEKSTATSKEEALSDLSEAECDLVVVFPADFDAKLALFMDPDTSNDPAEAVKPVMHYDSTSARSQTAYEMVYSLLSSLEMNLNRPFIDLRETGVDIASEEDVQGMLYAMLLPMLLMAMLFSGCMAVAPESIAGEKERGTIATMLVTPLQRSHLALGKIISLSAIALLSGLSSTVGILLSLPKLMGDNMNANVFSVLSVPDMLALLCVILSTVLVIVALVSVVSAYAKSVKEATTFVSPLMIFVMLLGVTNMFITGELPILSYLVPLFNSVNCIAGIFERDYSWTSIALTAFANLAVVATLTYLLTQMFNHERMISDK